jgi:STE24 endopeptidase
VNFSALTLVVLALLLAKAGAQLWLELVNRRNVLAHAGAVPKAFKAVIDEAGYAKTVRYTLAKGRFHEVELLWNLLILIAVLFSGVLPWAFRYFSNSPGVSAWAMAAFLFAVGLVLSIPGLPLDWFAQFRLEESFGFNTSTQKVWWSDRLKGLLLAVILGYPLLVLVLKLVEWMGESGLGRETWGPQS